MRYYVARSISGNVYPVMGSLAARFHYSKAAANVSRNLFLLWVFFLFSPLLFVFTLIMGVLIYYRDIYETFFSIPSVKSTYERLLRPMVADTIYATLGYRVYQEEVIEHLAILEDSSSKGNKRLAEKGKKMSKIPYRQMGFNLDTLTRHLALFGTTGAGKTETLMSLFERVISSYGSLGFIDGKSDQTMENKIYNICKEHYYETQFYAIILNNPEKGTESNTYAPLLSYDSPMKASEFLGELLGGGGGGDGNHDYFVNRGKVAMGNMVHYFKNRQRYYGENFSISDLELAISPTEINNIYYMAYCTVVDIEERIVETAKRDGNFGEIVRKSRGVKTAQIEYAAHTEILVEYVRQNSHLSRQVERAIGVNWKYVEESYGLFSTLKPYISGISDTWYGFAHSVAVGMHIVLKSEGFGFLYDAPKTARMSDIRKAFEDIRTGEGNRLVSLGSKGLIKNEMLRAIGVQEDGTPMADAGETVNNISPDNMRQHNYAQQQWSRMFGLFGIYGHIYGTPTPELDGENSLKNNHIVFIMLPALGLSEDQLRMAGKIHILMFKNVASIAIGGEKQSATPIQFQIFQNKIKPNPIHLMVLDEIGSYNVPGLSYLLSQVRSLRIGMILSGQDYVSLKPPGGDDELARNTANVGKIIMRTRDKDTVSAIEAVVNEIEVIEEDSFIKSAVNARKVLGGSTQTIKSVKCVNVRSASSFRKGFGLYVDEETLEPVYFQSYYLGDNAKHPIQIRRFESYSTLIAA